ncbi:MULTISPECIES: hypothetical protein [unclassified Streptomyces]|uniref:hypothetical protein n=1 Tax=unclassified Streptomyces TaxID=2593676 RepID=UPI002DD7CFA2|nr:hypothetical protein [Streptomyces sp. NBC_01294]WRZ58209.1 hypothetical protein OG534_17890 [Streptomyces sp. NBC_01294]
MSIAELQVYSVEEADVTGGVCVVRCVGGVARAGQVYAVGESRIGLRHIERYGRPVGSFDAGHVAKVHLTGAMVALLTRGQVLTSVPPDGHALEDLEAWLATGPPLGEEPHPRTLRVLAGVRMRDERLPDEVRLRWGRVALTATDRCARAEAVPDLVRAPERACVQVYLIQQFGPDRGGDPAALCRELLALIDLTPEQAAVQGSVWRDLPHHRIRHLRRIKGLIPWLVLVRPHLGDGDPAAAAVDAWATVRTLLP